MVRGFKKEKLQGDTMMKRIALLLFCVCMLAGLTACAGNGTTEDLSNSVSGVETSSSEQNVETSSSEQNVESSSEEITEPEEPAGEDEPGLDPDAPVVYTPTVVADTEQYSITAESVEYDSAWGWKLKLTFENKASSKLSFNTIAGAVNGVELSTPPYLGCAVDAGATVMNTVYLGEECFYSIPEDVLTVLTDIELTVQVGELAEIKGGEEYFSPIAEERLHIYPYGEERAAAYVREPQSTDTVLMDNEYVTVTLLGCRREDDFPIMGYMVELFIENKSDVDIWLSESDTSINGQQMRSYFVDAVQAGDCSFSRAVWSNNDYEIPEVEEIVLTLKVQGENATVLVEDTPVTIHP